MQLDDSAKPVSQSLCQSRSSRAALSPHCRLPPTHLHTRVSLNNDSPPVVPSALSRFPGYCVLQSVVRHSRDGHRGVAHRAHRCRTPLRSPHPRTPPMPSAASPRRIRAARGSLLRGALCSACGGHLFSTAGDGAFLSLFPSCWPRDVPLSPGAFFAPTAHINYESRRQHTRRQAKAPWFYEGRRRHGRGRRTHSGTHCVHGHFRASIADNDTRAVLHA